MVAVAASEPAAVRIEAHPILAPAGLRTEFMRAWVEPEVAARQLQRRQIRSQRRRDGAAVTAAGLQVNAVVEPPDRTVRERLDVEALLAAREAGERDVATLGATIAVLVFEKEDVGRRNHVHAAARADQARRPGQVLREHRPRLVHAVAIAILQAGNPSEVRNHVTLLGIIDHLADEHAATLVEGDRDG